MAQNRVMQQKNLVNRKRIAKEKREARYRVMSCPSDPRNIGLTLFKEEPGVCKGVTLKREPGQKWGCAE